MASTAAVIMDMVFMAAAAIGIMADSTVTIGSVADSAEVMNFTAAMASMEEAQSVAVVDSTVVAKVTVVAVSTAVAEAMAADTGNRGFFA
jgi:hypothetical protein